MISLPASERARGAPRGNPFAPRRYGELQRITGRVYLFRNITNSTFVIGDRTVAVIDTQVNKPSAQRLLESVRSVTDKPIGFVVNTHYHWDHTNGNALFKREGARIVASALTADFMTRRRERQKRFLEGRGFDLGDDPLSPDVTFDGEFRIDLGDCPLRLFFAGRAETDDATAVHVERDNVVLSGDTVMTGSFPIFGQPVWDEGLQGDGEWQSAIRRIIAMKPSSVLPGHGPVAGEADLECLIRIEDYFVSEIARLVKKGLSLDRILADMEPRMPEWITRMPIVWGTPRYAILRVWRGLTKRPGDPEAGWQRFKPSAIPAAGRSVLGREAERCRTVKDFLSAAAEAREGGDGALSLAILGCSTEAFPGSCEALCARAEALVEASRAESSVLEKGDFFDPARALWDRALAIDPDHVGALLGKGRYFAMMAYRAGDDPSRAIRLLERVIDLAPGGRDEAEACFYLGMAYRTRGDEVEAGLRFRSALARDPSFAPAALAAGNSGS